MKFPSKNGRLFRTLNGFVLINLFVRICFTVFFLWLQNRFLLLYTGFSVLIWVYLFFVNQQGRQRIVFSLCIVEIIVFSTLTTLVLGWECGFFFLLAGLIPLTFFDAGIKRNYRFIQGGLISILIVALYEFSQLVPSIFMVLHSMQNLLFGFNLLMGCITLGLLGYFFEVTATNVENEILQANQKLLNMANTDPVTNLINRRIMMAKIEQEKDRVDRGGKPFSLIMIDVDNFKQINDEYGHDGGDYVLVSLAEKINFSLRKADVISRWGGDEFLLLLPETILEEGGLVAEKIRQCVLFSPFVYREMDIPVTVTFGVGQCDRNVGIGVCIRKADQALYRGKQNGKNRVVILE